MWLTQGIKSGPFLPPKHSQFLHHIAQSITQGAFMSELVYYVASTLDGFIAHQDGSFDGFEWDDEVVADFIADQSTFDTVIMGRKTYEVGLNAGKTSPYPGMRQIVFSRTLKSSPDKAVELANGNLIPTVSALKEEDGGSIWLCGGSELATPLLQANLIDKIIIKLNPVVFGSGIPLLNAMERYASLHLEETKTYKCGIVFLTYRVS